MKKYFCFLIFNFFIGLWFISPAEAVLGYITRGFKSCTEECSDQSKICKNSELSSWCYKNCRNKADKNGRLLDGKCFEVLTHNAQNNATSVTAEYALQELARCNARINESKEMVSFTKGTHTEVLKKLIQQVEGLVQDLGAPISRKVREGRDPKEYGGDLIAFMQGCNNLNNKINDFAYWSKGMTPMGGFKSVKPGTSKEEINALFEKIIKDNK